jgi:hypothetical protein
MPVHRSGPLAVAVLLAAAGCGKSVSQRSIPQTLVVAVYSSPSIPTPNDLALQAVPTFPDPSAQRNLLQSFVNAGGFPADQAPTLSVPLRAYTWDDATHQYLPAEALPVLDPTTVTPTTAALFRIDVDPPERVPVAAVEPAPAGYVNLVPAGDASGRRLPAGRYVFAVRGGSHGVKTTDGLPIAADTAVALTIPNKDLTNPENQPPGGIPDLNQSGSNLDELQQLESLRAALWAPSGWVSAGGFWRFCADPTLDPKPDGCSPAPAPAYATIEAAFPVGDIASIAAFQIAAPTGQTVAAVDAASGAAPLPFDLLRTGPDGHIALNPAFGPAAEGLTTLDGFSTTAMILAPVITPGSAVSAIDASTVHGGNVFLFKLGDGAPELLPELKYVLNTAGNPLTARYVAEPTPIVVPQGTGCPIAGGCSSVIGLQPAVNTGLGLYLPPLEEKTTYAVVITDRVHDLAGQPIARPTLMTLLLDGNPLVHPLTGASLVGGLDDATAAVLQQMRTDLGPVFDAVAGAGTSLDHVVLAYTFKTQDVTDTAMQIAGIPYQQAGVGTVLSASYLTPAQAAGQYGIDAAYLPAAPGGPVAEVAEVRLATVSLLLDSANSGAFDPDHPAPEPVTALVALPNPALVTGTCPPGSPAFTVSHCAPLVVFRHGITRSKADVLAAAAALTAHGFVVAAIDGEKHGDRSWCTSDAQCCPAALCGVASTCAFKENLTGPTDGGTPIGVCESAPGVRGGYLNYRIDCADPFLADGVTPDQTCFSPKGVPYVSGNYLVSMNFFRTRDSLRQDVIDQSALVKALAPYGQGTDALALHLAESDYAVDPTRIYWLSQSLGSSQGAVDLAAIPRFQNAVFNAPGATLVDIFANPESHFHQTLLDLLDPIVEGTPDYLKTLQVAKWILDPADPANFAPHVLADRLTSPLDALPGNPTSRSALVQAALCDGTIPNAQNAYFASQLGVAVPAAGAASNGYVQWYLTGATGAVCPDNAATHGFLLDGVDASLTSQAQTTAGAFLASPAAEPATVRPAP